MSTSGLKSDKLHAYQKKMIPFWRSPDNAGLYSEATREMFELKKLEFDKACKYYQWQTKPQER